MARSGAAACCLRPGGCLPACPDCLPVCLPACAWHHLLAGLTGQPARARYISIAVLAGRAASGQGCPPFRATSAG